MRKSQWQASFLRVLCRVDSPGMGSPLPRGQRNRNKKNWLCHRGHTEHRELQFVAEQKKKSRWRTGTSWVQIAGAILRAGLGDGFPRRCWRWRSGGFAGGSGGDFHFELGGRFGEVLDTEVQVGAERGAGGDEVADDHVLLEADEGVDRFGQCGFG